MPRTTYAQPVDVLRRFDPTITTDDLADGSDYFYGQSAGGSDIDAEDRIYSRIEEVENLFDQQTDNPQRLTTVGGHGNVYEFHDADLHRYQGGVKVFLDHRGIEPIDVAEGDSIEIRTGRDSWRDITGSEGELWRMNYVKGVLQLVGYYRYTNAVWRNSIMDDNIRINYRFGGLGGGRRKPGQSSLSSSLSQGTTNEAEVDDASRFPAGGAVVLVGDEYVRYESADWDNDKLLNLTRGVRHTTDADRDSGDTVHYCPMMVRSAVASKTAVELMTYEDWVAETISTGQELDPSPKIDQWNAEWEKALGRFSEVKMI